MRKILLFLFVFISFIEKSLSDDIKDFQIADMNVRDSLLNYFDKNSIIEELNSKYTFFYKQKKYAILTAGNTKDFPLRINTGEYDDIGITIRPNDKKFIIYGLSGRIFCENDINYCKSKKKRN